MELAEHVLPHLSDFHGKITFSHPRKGHHYIDKQTLYLNNLPCDLQALKNILECLPWIKRIISNVIPNLNIFQNVIIPQMYNLRMIQTRNILLLYIFYDYIPNIKEVHYESISKPALLNFLGYDHYSISNIRSILLLKELKSLEPLCIWNKYNFYKNFPKLQKIIRLDYDKLEPTLLYDNIYFLDRTNMIYACIKTNCYKLNGIKTLALILRRYKIFPKDIRKMIIDYCFSIETEKWEMCIHNEFPNYTLLKFDENTIDICSNIRILGPAFDGKNLEVIECLKIDDKIKRLKIFP